MITCKWTKGRFGNQLFQIAGVIGTAVKAKQTFGFPAWSYQKYFVNPLPAVTGKHADIKVLSDYRNFNHCKAIIKYYFRMHSIKEPPANTVFIHFRAYSDERLAHIHPEQSGEYYREAIKHFKGKNFIIFTDNVSKAKKVIGEDFIYRRGGEMEDFYMMSRCEGGIISNSTFSWWAGWLCGGKVVAPSNWFAGRKKDRDTSGYYLPDWIKI